MLNKINWRATAWTCLVFWWVWMYERNQDWITCTILFVSMLFGSIGGGLYALVHEKIRFSAFVSRRIVNALQRKRKKCKLTSALYAKLEYELSALGRIDEALDVCGEAQEFGFTNENLYVNWSVIYFKQGDFESESQVLEAALAEGIKTEEVYFRLAKSYFDQGRTYEAIQISEEARDNGALNAGGYNNLGFFYEKLAMYDHTIEVLEEARFSGNVIDLTYLTLANVYGHQCRWEKVVEVLKEARFKRLLNEQGYQVLARAFIHLDELGKLDILLQDAKKLGITINVEKLLNEVGGLMT